VLSSESRILIVGAGSSSNALITGLSEELHDDGYTNITNIDYSPSVVSYMQDKLKEKDPPI